jgi:CHAD domain-containing protein
MSTTNFEPKLRDEGATELHISPGFAHCALKTSRKRLKVALDDVRTGLSNHHVHALRTTSRRASAGIALLSLAAPRRAARRLLDDLRRERQQFSTIRNCDALLEVMLAWSDAADRDLLTDLLVQVALRRAREERRIRNGGLQPRSRRILRRFRKLMVDVERRLAESPCRFRDSLFAASRKPMERLRQASESSCVELPVEQPAACTVELSTVPPVDLYSEILGWHPVRIACKRLRYLLEFVEEMLPANVGQLVFQQLREAQSRLGYLLDTAAALHYLRTRDTTNESTQDSLARDRIQHAQEEKLQAAYAAFRAWWSAGRLHEQVASLIEDQGDWAPSAGEIPAE